MRIIAGQFRGRLLERPPHLETRPTADRVRESIFSMLTSHLKSWENIRVLDAFAGSGAMGLEALSRGAASAQFIDKSMRTFKTLLSNIKALGVENQALAYKGDFFRVTLKGPFNVVFLDPPYYQSLIAPSLAFLETPGILFRNAVIVSEMSVEDKPFIPPGYVLLTERIYGSIKVMLHRLDSRLIN